MFELPKTEEVAGLIAMTKSDSGISGPQLAKAHMRLGSLLARHMDVDPEDTTVVAMLRGGIFFAEGIYFELGCRFELYDPRLGPESFIRPATRDVIIVDSVINTGSTVRQILTPDMRLACCVINRNAVSDFSDVRLYAVRSSANSFVGADVKVQERGRGPDTTMRLFNQL